MRYTLALFFALIILPTLNAQVVIRGKVVVSPSSDNGIEAKNNVNELQPLESPSLIQLDFNRYLVLRSGNLSFRLKSGHSIPNYTLDKDSIFVKIFKPNGLVTDMSPKAYSDKLIEPYLVTDRNDRDSTYWYRQFSTEYSRRFFNSTYVSNLNCVVFRGKPYEKGKDETNTDFSSSQVGYSAIDTFEVGYYLDNDPDNEWKTKRCEYRRESLLSTALRFKAYGITLMYADLYLTGSYSGDQTSGSTIYSTPETWVDNLVRWDSRPLQRTKLKEIDGSITDITGQRIIVDLSDYIRTQLTSSATEHRFIIAPSQETTHTLSFWLKRPQFKFKLKNNNPAPIHDALELGYVEAGDIIQLQTKFFAESYRFSEKGTDEITGNEVYPTNYRQSIPISDSRDRGLLLNADIVFEPEDVSDDVALKVYLGTSKQAFTEDSIAVPPGDSVYVTLGFEFPNGAVRKLKPSQIILAEMFEDTEFGSLSTIAPDTFLVTTIDSLSTDSAVIKTRFIASITGGGIIAGKMNPDGINDKNLNQNAAKLSTSAAPESEASGITEEDCIGPYPANWPGIYYGCASITIQPISGIYALADPDTIAPGQTSNLTVQHITAQADTIDFPTDQLFQVNLADSSAQYGNLISADNADTADVLTDALQGGKFISTYPVNDTTEISIVIHTTYKNENLEAELKLILIPNIKIVAIEELEDELWPYLPDQTDGQSRGDNRPGYNPFDSTFSVMVLNGEIPLNGQEVSFSVDYELGTGGHIHTNPLPDNAKGRFWGNESSGNEIIIISDEEGIAQIDSFRTSQVSGEFDIMVTLQSDTSITYQEDLQVIVPGLTNFAGVSSNGRWRLTGAIAGLHTDNHWIHEDALNNMINALEDFYDWSQSRQNNQQAILLGINDISLIFGGSYEYNGDWNLNNQHSFHRIGFSVDIDQRHPVNGQFILLTQEQRNELTRIMARHQAVPYDEPTIHYGFNGEN